MQYDDIQSLSNLGITSPKIKAYFNGDDKYVPTSELLYIHTHPLVQPNFLADIEGFINLTAEHMVQKTMTGKPVERFTILATKLGRLLSKLDKDSAAEVLDVLRDIYRLCAKVTGTPGPLGR